MFGSRTRRDTAEAIFTYDKHVPGIRVLLIEDYEDLRDTLAELLEAIGYRVQAVSGSVEARALAVRPDVIVSELELPDGDSEELLRDLRARPGWSDLACVALTSTGSREKQERARRAGFERCMVKPISLRDLSTVLRDAAGACDLSVGALLR